METYTGWETEGSGTQEPLSGTKTKYIFLVLTWYHPFSLCSLKSCHVRATLNTKSVKSPPVIPPSPTKDIFPPLPLLFMPSSLSNNLPALHYCTCIRVICLFIWLKTKVLKGLGPYLARTWQYLAQSRHSESISWTLFPWIENGIWHYSGHCVNWHNGVEEISW